MYFIYLALGGTKLSPTLTELSVCTRYTEMSLTSLYKRLFRIHVEIFILNIRLGAVACICNPATWRSGLVDHLSSGALLVVALWRSGVRAKLGIDMVGSAEAETTRSSKEGRTGPGRKLSRQKSPCGAVVGLRS